MEIKDRLKTFEAPRKCPYGLCKGRLILRENKNTGGFFYSCSNYPKCDYSEPFYKEDEE